MTNAVIRLLRDFKLKVLRNEEANGETSSVSSQEKAGTEAGPPKRPTYSAIFETGSLQSLFPVLPPSPQICMT
jgi:hypothetical protein